MTRRRLLHWAARFPCVCWLDSCDTNMDRHGRFDWMMGVSSREGFARWKDWQQHEGEWRLGALPYEWKSHQDPRLQSAQPASIDWPEAPGFVPELLLVKPRFSQRVWVLRDSLPGWEESLQSDPLDFVPGPAPDFQSNFPRDAYLLAVERLRDHIREGDCYEVNLAQVFEAPHRGEVPHELFLELIRVSPVPFAAYLKMGGQHVLSASPERFLQHRKGQLITQPIKGTARRGNSMAEDIQLKELLRSSEKEQAENVMIVDLSRHDLNRFCQTNSVEVPRLFEIQTFPQVHQMVSTVRGKLRQEVGAMDALEGIFPPGSMTGAPKFRVMQIIDAIEGIGRGLYAGSVGYMAPGGDFDFNVIIRSLMIDEKQQTMNYHVGGAITYDSDPEEEYEETLIKAKAIRRVFSDQTITASP